MYCVFQVSRFFWLQNPGKRSEEKIGISKQFCKTMDFLTYQVSQTKNLRKRSKEKIRISKQFAKQCFLHIRFLILRSMLRILSNFSSTPFSLTMSTDGNSNKQSKRNYPSIMIVGYGFLRSIPLASRLVLMLVLMLV